jgi:ferrous iron transport protein A
MRNFIKRLLTANESKYILTIERSKNHTILRKEDEMMPLSMVSTGEQNVIKKVGGKEETRKFLENLGFVTGGVVTVVSEISGNLIVNVKDSRVAIGKDMANKIMV